MFQNVKHICLLVNLNNCLVLFSWQAAKVPVKEYDYQKKKLLNLQPQLVFLSTLKKVQPVQVIFVKLQKRISFSALINYVLLQEKLVGENYYLNQSAKDAYRSYLLAYNSHSMKEIFNVHRLNLKVIIQ